MSQYILRFSVTAFLVWVLQMLPVIVRLVNPPQKDVWQSNRAKNQWLNRARQIAEVLTVLLLLFAVNREKGDALQINSGLLLAVLFLVIYYAAWIQYFRGKASPFSLIFGIALMKPLYLMAAAQCLNNSLLIIPCVIYGILHCFITALRFWPRRKA
jgi:hypothetical protein